MSHFMPYFFAVCCVVILYSLYKVHKDPDIDFNLLDLLLENGRVSKISVLVMGAFFVMSWIMLSLEATSRMTEGYMGLYGTTFVAPLLAKLFIPAKEAK